jgi:dipeptidyl aminopeptidase/acylaminoacyl peptidase
MPFLLARLARFGAAVLLATSALASQAQAPQAPPSIARFFADPQFARPALSPDGKLLAVVTATSGKRDGLTVIDLANKKIHTAALFRDADIGNFQWVNDERLVFDTRDKQTAPGDTMYGPGLYAANFDGSKMKQLADRRGGWKQQPNTGRERLLPWHTFLRGQRGAQDSDAVYVNSPSYGGANGVHDVNLLLLDTVTGRAKRVERPDNTTGWVLDHLGQPRLALSVDQDKQTIHVRDPGTDSWRVLVTFDIFGNRAGFIPLAFGPDGTLYVEATNAKDKAAVYAYDLASGKLREPALVTTADYDFTGQLIMNKDKLLGVRVTTDAESTIWLDPEMKALQAEIDQRLDATVNMLSVPVRAATPWVLVESYSDTRAPSFALYNRSTKAFTKVGDSYPDLPAGQMGRQETVSYKARDGLSIPAVLTLPAGAKRAGLPLVVLVHGGPYLRGAAWGWKANAQFLASRGYAVLEPDYRGSTGYGYQHFRAGWKQWGLAMQNDIADGAKWAIAQGIVDPKRICIAGASYGGYATLMGLVNDPELYKCGINWVGVTDLGLLHSGHWSYESDMTERYRKYGMPLLVGDPVADAAQFAATSPLVQAARIKQPLLLAYGGADKRVPLFHGNKFYAAVKQTNPNVEWVVYPEEGHGWRLQETREDFWGRVEKFLERNIGK